MEVNAEIDDTSEKESHYACRKKCHSAVEESNYSIYVTSFVRMAVIFNERSPFDDGPEIWSL